MLEELRAQECFGILLLLLLEVTVGLLPSDAVDQISNHVQNIFFHFIVQREFLLDVSYVL